MAENNQYRKNSCHNMSHSSMNNANNEVSASSSTSEMQSSSLLSVNHGDSALMIPLSAENLDTLRASGIQFSSSGLSVGSSSVNLEENSSAVTGSGSFNLSFGNVNMILNNGVDASDSGVILEAVSLNEHNQHHHHQQHLQLQQHHQQSIQTSNQSAGSNGRNMLHSNEISSNNIMDSQSLGNGHVLNLNNSEGIHICDVSNSASGLIQALGAAVSRAVANSNLSSLFSTSMNLPLTMNQNGNEIITFNTVSPNTTPNQQHQLLLNQINANSLLNALPSTNLLSSSSAAESSSHSLMSRGGRNSMTQSSGIGNSSLVTVTIDQQQQQQQQHLWVQPDQSSFLPSTINLASQGLSLQGAITLQSPTSSQDNSIQVQELQHSQINGNHFQDLRSQFPGVFQVSQQGNRNDTYQGVAHSTFGQAINSQDYRSLGEDSEATPSYSGSQHLSNEVTVNTASQLVSAPVVDSSTLQQGYQLVFDAENRVITVQRVMSPSDCTVSQSSLSFENSEAQASMLPIGSQSGQAFTMVHVNSVQNPFGPGSSANEVSTTSMVRSILGTHDQGSNMAGSSIDDGMASSSYSHSEIALPKIEIKSDFEEATECDTTQEDDYQHTRSPNYMDTSSNNIDEEQSLDSTTLHSTMQAAASSEEVMGHALNSSDLDSMQPVAMSQDSGQELMPGPSGLQQFVSSETPKVDSVRQPARVVGCLRKSKRLEKVKLEPKASQRKKDYKSQPYSVQCLWCEDCMQIYENGCPTHKVAIIQDRVVLTRAYASLPNQLQIIKINDSQPGDTEPADHGVQAKRQIAKYTQFGPLVADLVDSIDQVTRKSFPLMLELPDGSFKYLDCVDEDKCNWMMFVRPAKTFAEQNLVAYQYKDGIYFSVTKQIESKQELKVWYAAHYAGHLGVKTLELTEEDMRALDEADAKFGCFECSRKFMSSAALQQHLSTHDAEDMRDLDEDGDHDGDFFTGSEDGVKGRLKTKRAGRRAIRNKRLGDSYQWKKKKSTTIYLSKTLKRYKRRQCSEKTLLTVKGMYKHQGKVSGGSEWMCTHCDLTFDNSSLLNLHTLTHAAEDLGMEEFKKLAAEQGTETGVNVSDGTGDQDNASGLANIMALNGILLACPECNKVFDDHKSLMNHVAMHAQPTKNSRPFNCTKCSKRFSTQEKLIKHQMVHGDESEKPLQCTVCLKRVMNNSAMACHMKIHSEKKYYDCPLCNEDFDMVSSLRDHALKHMDEQGHYPCKSCPKVFDDFTVLKKHTKGFHSDKMLECPECSKPFPRLDKLRLHMLRHTSHREFMCETCGRQFKRKDKLKEHTRRMHSKERVEQQLFARQHNMKHSTKFTPKVLPSEWHRFIYKCHSCLLGFKRRGMLVNHLAKRHPEIKPENVPELNLPILKTQKDFYCQYCDKIYKSSSKRKTHIQKNHPGLPIPPSARKKLETATPTFSHTVSSVTTMPHGCKFCHKQYASKAKLLQHQRKLHPDFVEPVHERKKIKKSHPDFLITVADPNQGMERYEGVPITVVSQGDSVNGADLLTQAMSELQSYTTDFINSSRLTTGCTPTMVHIQSNGQLQPTTIDINQLNLQLHSLTSQNGGVATVLTQPTQPTSPTQLVTVVAPNGSQTLNLSNAQFITKAWTSGFPSTFR
ncbi:PR domain zinc finger protein 10 [Biomphalaria glabrata]|nr:PR domain zinc finger protein 10 [Biomphalaria glabrata]